MRSRYFKTVVDGVVTQVCAAELEDSIVADGEITEEEYNAIIDSIQDEPQQEEATEDDYIEALEELGVDTHEEG